LSFYLTHSNSNLEVQRFEIWDCDSIHWFLNHVCSNFGPPCICISDVQLPSLAFSEDFQAEFLQHYHVVFDQFRHKFLAGEMVWNFADFMTPQGNKLHTVKKVKADIGLHGNPISATGRHLPYGITQCYLPPDTSEHTPPNPSHAGWYSVYLPRRDGRLSWPSWLDSAPAGSRTSDLSITSPTPNRCTTKTTSSHKFVTEGVQNPGLVGVGEANLIGKRRLWLSIHNYYTLAVPRHLPYRGIVDGDTVAHVFPWFLNCY